MMTMSSRISFIYCSLDVNLNSLDITKNSFTQYFFNELARTSSTNRIFQFPPTSLGPPPNCFCCWWWRSNLNISGKSIIIRQQQQRWKLIDNFIKQRRRERASWKAIDRRKRSEWVRAAREKLIINWLELLSYLFSFLFHLRDRHLDLTSNNRTSTLSWGGSFFILFNEISDPNQNPFKSKLINWIMGGVIDCVHTHKKCSSSLNKWIDFTSHDMN